MVEVDWAPMMSLITDVAEATGTGAIIKGTHGEPTPNTGINWAKGGAIGIPLVSVSTNIAPPPTIWAVLAVKCRCALS